MNTQSISAPQSFFYKFIAIILIAVLGLAATPILMASADTIGYFPPTKSVSHGPGWSNPANVLASDNMYTVATKNNKQLKLSNFFLPPIPGGSTINGIEVTVEGFTAGIQADVAISGGAGFSSAKTTTLTGSESTLILGGSSDTWGRTWSASDFTNKFLIRLTANGTSGALSIDQVQVKVYYTRPNTTLVLSPVSGNYNGSASMTATLTMTATSLPLVGRTVNFTLNGVSAGSAITNGSGVATVASASLAGITAGDYPYGAAASYAGDGTTDPTSITADLRVYGVATTLVVSPGSGPYNGSTGVVTATLTETVSGLPVSGKTIDFTLNDFPVGSPTTDGSGVATISGVSLNGYDAGLYTGAFDVSFAGDANMEPSSGSSDLTVTPLNLTVTGGLVPSNKVYDGTTAATLTIGSPSLNGVVNPDDVSLNTAGATGTFSDKNVGTAKTVQISGLALGGAQAGNYTLTQPTRQANITQATLTVTANNQTIAAGSPDPAFTFSYSAFASGDSSADINTAPTCGVSGAHAGPGSYDIVCSGGVDDNYAFNYVKGTLTVNAVGNAPTNIALSKSDINEGLPSGTAVGTLSTTDPDPGDTFTYDFCGGTDDASFTIAGNTLQSAANFNWTTKRTYSICVRSTDNNTLSTTKAFSIKINKTSATFQDVQMDYWAWSYVELLSVNGVTAGCAVGPLRYCPTAAVTRDQMAVFLLKAEHGAGYVPPKATGIFADVATNYWAADWIERLYAEGITSGCATAPLRYCPTTPITRDQMAVFLLKAEHGSGYTPPAASHIFTDLPTNFWAESWIERLYAEGITGGCSSSPLRYCPTTVVARDQMAVFLVKTFNLP